MHHGPLLCRFSYSTSVLLPSVPASSAVLPPAPAPRSSRLQAGRLRRACAAHACRGTRRRQGAAGKLPHFAAWAQLPQHRHSSHQRQGNAAPAPSPAYAERAAPTHLMRSFSARCWSGLLDCSLAATPISGYCRRQAGELPCSSRVGNDIPRHPMTVQPSLGRACPHVHRLA